LESVEDAVYFRLSIFEREVMMSGRVGFVARNFPNHFNGAESVDVTFDDVS
jgi:hypothetical protein